MKEKWSVDEVVDYAEEILPELANPSNEEFARELLAVTRREKARRYTQFRNAVEFNTGCAVPSSLVARAYKGRTPDQYVLVWATYDNLGGRTVTVYAVYQGQDGMALFQAVGERQWDGIGPELPSWVYAAPEHFSDAAYEYVTFGVNTPVNARFEWYSSASALAEEWAEVEAWARGHIVLERAHSRILRL